MFKVEAPQRQPQENEKRGMDNEHGIRMLRQETGESSLPVKETPEECY